MNMRESHAFMREMLVATKNAELAYHPTMFYSSPHHKEHDSELVEFIYSD